MARFIPVRQVSLSFRLFRQPVSKPILNFAACINRPSLTKVSCFTIAISKKYNSSISDPNKGANGKVVPQNKLEKEVAKRIIESQIKSHIPGETAQSNDLVDRIPRFPLAKENVPSLIPRPGVPPPGSNLTKMVHKLKTSPKEELIYESESHRLYFLFCGAFALVCTIYGLLFLEWALNSAWNIYATNEQNLPETHNLVMYIARNLVTLAIFAFPAGLAALFITLPTRLIRRIWYIPAKVAAQLGHQPQDLVKFTCHPFLPGRPTPVHTMPLALLNRSYKTKIFTNKGFYLTIDKGSFLFLLKEGTKKIPWLVDRKGFFYGDGRVFDHLFGKESLEEADLAISYDDKFGAINEKIKQDVAKLKNEHGVGWQFKEQGKLMKQDLKVLADKIKSSRTIAEQKHSTKKIAGNSNTLVKNKKKNKSNKQK